MFCSKIRTESASHVEITSIRYRGEEEQCTFMN